MAKAVWTGTLSLGLVNVPVSLYAATEPKDVRFHLFDRAGRRVRYRRVVDVAPEDEDPEVDPPVAAGEMGPDASLEPAGERRDAGADAGQREVAYADLVRGFEVDRDRFVTLEPQEIERARPQASHTIDLEHFVRLDEIDPIYFEKSYFLAPKRGSQAEKPYVLLLRAMQKEGRVGIGRFVLRSKPHLVAIRPMNGVFGLSTLFFGDEVRNPGEIVSSLDAVEVSEGEVEVAETLIQMLSTHWDPDAYADEYREELLRLISEKTAVDVEATDVPVNESRFHDLMEALLQSVEAARQREAGPKRKGRRAG